MRRHLLFLVINIIFIANASSQPVPSPQSAPSGRSATSAPFDRNRLLDYFQDQHFDEAIDYLLPIVAHDSSNIPLLGYLGYAYYMQDNAVAARNCYGHIITLDTVNLTALYYLAILYRNEDPDTALVYANRLLALQPTRAPWWLMVGTTLTA